MKISNDYIVMRDKKTGAYLEEIKNHPHSLATRASFVNNINGALSMSYGAYLEQKSQLKALAKIHGMEILRVKANLELTYPNGSEVQVINCESESPSLFDLLKRM